MKMRSALASAFHDTDTNIRKKARGLLTALVLSTLLLWSGVLALSFCSTALVIPLALAAWVLGAVHAFDATTIAATNAVTCAMVRRQTLPVAIGLFFPLGYATVLVGMCLYLASTSTLGPVEVLSPTISGLGAIVGSVVLVIAARRCLEIAHLGVLSNVAHPLGSSRRMYFTGAVFGLTLTPSLMIGGLSLYALAAVSGLPLWSLLVFAALFASGMALVSSAISCLMNALYWKAFSRSVAGRYERVLAGYTGVAALFVGAFELVSTGAAVLNLQNGSWGWLVSLREQNGFLGLAMLGVFVGIWGVEILLKKRRPRVSQAALVALPPGATPTSSTLPNYQVTTLQDHMSPTVPLKSTQDNP